jgi:hypothetical protein
MTHQLKKLLNVVASLVESPQHGVYSCVHTKIGAACFHVSCQCKLWEKFAPTKECRNPLTGPNVRNAKSL